MTMKITTDYFVHSWLQYIMFTLFLYSKCEFKSFQTFMFYIVMLWKNWSTTGSVKNVHKSGEQSVLLEESLYISDCIAQWKKQNKNEKKKKSVRKLVQQVLSQEAVPKEHWLNIY